MLRPGLIFAAGAAVFWAILVLLIPPNIQVELLTALLLPLGGMAMWRWLPGALRNLFGNDLVGGKILTIAVATMAFAVSFMSIWRLAYLWLSRPVSMTSDVNPWSGFAVYLFDIVVVLYLLATRRETDPPMPTLMWVVIGGASFVTLVGFLIRNLV